ncbi:Type 4 prepilin-like proteins leader peptide-processing enzyme [Pigmentiphaga humi]|uniref:Prepilin leader peptidase/N-methyltransferase n=1 Tax=Pigmentiphaga humi TaxID=2478468 RepID=A0A3P4B175_9BURK|nr:A24 family peptidase [Pigmentiphaga humi]VCU70037.1 Type 4 prepilin-like proteins leader peptide-processing enzyme [Pigmentiphaga humi]
MSFVQILAATPWLAYASAIVLGLVVGSFLNVVIVRLPVMMERAWQAQCAELCGQPASADAPLNLARPASHCPACRHPIAWRHNVPLFGWIALRGRCAHCGVRIAWHYPAVELATAALFAACVAVLGVGWPALAAMAFCAACVALAVIDLQTSLLPDDLTLPLLWAGLFVNLWGVFAPLAAAVVGAIAGYGVLWAVYWAFRLATGKEGMGYGDFKLLAAIGAWLGWQSLPLVMVAASLAGLLAAGALLLTGRMRRGETMPFGPCLAAAGIMGLLGADFWTKLAPW